MLAIVVDQKSQTALGCLALRIQGACNGSITGLQVIQHHVGNTPVRKVAETPAYSLYRNHVKLSRAFCQIIRFFCSVFLQNETAASLLPAFSSQNLFFWEQL